MVNGLVLNQKISHLAGGINRVEKAKIGLIQFCISPPKTDVSVLQISCPPFVFCLKNGVGCLLEGAC